MSAFAAAPAHSRPFRIDDYLSIESFRHAEVSADGRRAAIAWGAAAKRASSFDNDLVSDAATGRILLLDGATGRTRTLAGCAAGCTLEGFSPSGRWLAISRLTHRRLEVGLVRWRSASPQWLGVYVAPASLGRRMQWRSDREILVLSPVAAQTPTEWRAGLPTYADTQRLWRAQAHGRASVRRIGSGRLDTPPGRPLADLIRVDVATRRRNVEARGSYDDLELSRDGRYVALTGPGADVPLRSQAQLDYDDITPRRRLSIVDLVSGSRWVPCASCDVTSTLLTWSPDNSKLLVFARRDPDVSWRNGSFLAIAPKDHIVRDLVAPGARPALQVRGSEHQSYAVGGWIDDDPLLLLADSNARMDWYRIGDASARNLTLGHDVASPRLGRVGDRPVIDRDAKATMIDRAGRWATLAGFGTSSPQDETGLRGTLNPPASQQRPDAATTTGVADARSVAAGDGWRLELASAPSGVQSLIDVTPGMRRTVLRLNPRLAHAETPLAVALPCQDPGRQGLADWLFLPPAAAHPAPLLILPYPGAVEPSGATPEAVLDHPQSTRILVGAGFAVLVPSLPRNLGSEDADADLASQVSAALNAAAATGRIDEAKVAIWGHSFGGYAALRLAERSTRFRAVIAQAGASDFTSFRGVFSPQVRVDPGDARRRDANTAATEAGQVDLRASPWEAPDRYIRHSPIFSADKISTPVLLVYGDQDFISLTQGEEMFSALHRLGKDAELMTYFGEGHVVASPANVRLLYERIMSFARWSFEQPTTIHAPPTP